MRIWLLQTGEPLPLNGGVRKMRTALLADTLTERGHQVTWWANAFEHQRKRMVFPVDCEYTLPGGINLRILRACGYQRNISLSRYLDHRILASKFRRSAERAEPPDVVVASMPCHHLAYEAVRYCREKDIPILVDVRDPWPDTFIDLLPNEWMKLPGKMFLAQDFARLKYLLNRCDGILAMSETMLEWALKKVCRSKGPWDHVFYMGYRKHSDPVTPVPVPDWLAKTESKKLAAYVGTFGRSYELELIVRAARHLKEAGRDDLCFVLAGTGEQEGNLQSEARSLPNLILPGWISSGEILLLLKRSLFGFVPCRSVDGALPNKVFEYLSAGLPIISSLEGEMADSVERYGIGLNYLPGDLEGLCRAILQLLENPVLREKMAANASDYFDNQGDADRIYVNYAAHIEKLAIEKVVGRKSYNHGF